MRTCKQCGEDFEVTEQDEAFCSWDCEDAHWDNDPDVQNYYESLLDAMRLGTES